MKLEFYHEALTKRFEQLTIIGIRISKNEDGEIYLVTWLLGMGFLLVFNNK